MGAVSERGCGGEATRHIGDDLKLSIGSGKYSDSDWVTLDADQTSGAQIIAAVPPLPPEVTGQKWEAVQMIHVLEHLYQWDAVQVLCEIHGILEVGGRLIIELPDLSFAAAVLLGVRDAIPGTAPGQCDMWPIYGDPNWRNPLYGHRWGYTPKTLDAALRAAGFSEIHLAPVENHVPVRDFRMEAVRT